MPDSREQENFYDGEGLRAGLKESGKTVTFLFLNGEILAECNGDRMPVRRHLPGLGLSHVQTLNDGIYHTYHQDEQWSTVYVTGSDGSVENCYLYDAFGNLTESQENITNRILYTGQQYDQETRQHYLRMRFYNSVIGRFTQEDTYRGDGLNLYAYCENNPVIYYDEKGDAKKNIISGKVGGAYKNVAANGGNVHHMPANSVSPYSTGKGPGVRMEYEDHIKTASWGSSKEAIAYREEQRKLINKGKFREAQQMDIDDIHKKFDDKYDKGIDEMKEYTDELLSKDPIEKSKESDHPTSGKCSKK